MRYHYYTDEKTIVIATSTYGKKIVRGIAKCNPNDEFDLEYGKRLAKARLDYKIAKKRAKRASCKFFDSVEKLNEAERYTDRMERYFEESEDEVDREYRNLKNIIAEKK